MTLKKFLKLFAPAAALLGFAAPGFAEESTLDRSDADPALWVVSDEDTKIYLFGTMHALKPDLVWFDDAVAEAFGESDELVLEMLDPDPAQIGPVLATQATYPTGKGLSQTLSEEQYARFAAGAQAIGVPPQALEQMRPWFAAVTLATVPLAMLGYSPESGAEKVLSTAAAERGIELIGLETFEEQMGFFANLSEEDQISFLMSGVDEIDGMEKAFTDMEHAWAVGDTAATAALLNESMEGNEVIYDVLLANRNAAWAEWIDDRMKRPGKVFVAVGAGHLSGKDSVQAMLAAKGLSATRIEY